MEKTEAQQAFDELQGELRRVDASGLLILDAKADEFMRPFEAAGQPGIVSLLYFALKILAKHGS